MTVSEKRKISLQAVLLCSLMGSVLYAYAAYHLSTLFICRTRCSGFADYTLLLLVGLPVTLAPLLANIAANMDWRARRTCRRWHLFVVAFAGVASLCFAALILIIVFATDPPGYQAIPVTVAYILGGISMMAPLWFHLKNKKTNPD